MRTGWGFSLFDVSVGTVANRRMIFSSRFRSVLVWIVSKDMTSEWGSVTMSFSFRVPSYRFVGDMSGSQSSHAQEGDSERCRRGDNGGRPISDSSDSGLQGTLPPSPAIAPPEKRSLLEAIVRAHEEPMFLTTLSRLLNRGGASVSRMVWATVQEILDRGPHNRAAIAWDIVEELCRHTKRNPTAQNFPPSAKTVAELISMRPDGALGAFKRLSSQYPLNALDVAQNLQVHSHSADGIKGFGFASIKESYADFVQHEANLPVMATLLKTAVSRRDPMSLEACLFIREKYEACRGWIGREAETAMLWQLRDQLTTLLLKVPVMCEANLKISLLFPRDVPHPALNREPQRLLAVERWILAQPRMLSEALGADHAAKIAAIGETDELDASHFLYLGSSPEARFRGIQAVASRFDRDGHILLPLARALGIEVPRIWEGEQCRQQPKERPPRSWISREDEERYETLQVSLACRCIALNYWKPEVSERMRQGAYEFLRGVVRERPYQLALAVPNLRKWHGDFYRDMLRMVRDEALTVWRRSTDATGHNDEVRKAIVLLDAFGTISSEVTRLALEELTLALKTPSESLMRDPEFATFVGAMRTSCYTSSTFEKGASAAVAAFPDTFGASQLSRNLSEVRAPDAAVQALIAEQAARSDLPVATWLNYAHSALVYGAESDTRQRIREVFEAKYERSVRMLARWSPKGRASYRIVVGSLYPERIGQISSLQTVSSNLFQSSLEARIKAAISDIPHVAVEGRRYIPWAPAIDGVLLSADAQIPPVVLLIDGEPYHSVNTCWSFRGFDGHSLLATKILTEAGYPVLRISGQLGEFSERAALESAICSAVKYLSSDTSVEDPRLVVNPPDTFKEIGGKALLFLPSATDGRLFMRRDLLGVNARFVALVEPEGESDGDNETDQGVG